MKIVENMVTSISSFINDEIEDPGCKRRLLFLCEQMELCLSKINLRRYSAELYVNALLWYSTSPACCRMVLESKASYLPSVRPLQKISSKMNTSTGTCQDNNYLNLRSNNLQAYERKASLVFDEIYVSHKIEYTDGKFV